MFSIFSCFKILSWKVSNWGGSIFWRHFHFLIWNMLFNFLILLNKQNVKNRPKQNNKKAKTKKKKNKTNTTKTTTTSTTTTTNKNKKSNINTKQEIKKEN